MEEDDAFLRSTVVALRFSIWLDAAYCAASYQSDHTKCVIN